MAGALTQLRKHAETLAAHGRHGDTELVHMSPQEVATLHALHPDGELPRNPDTGLPEAFDLGSIIGSIGGALLPIVVPGIGDSVGGALGLTDLLGQDFGAAAGGALTGGGLGLLGSLLSGGKNMGMAAGLGALGGGLTSYFSPEISGFLGTDGNAGGVLSSLFGSGSGTMGADSFGSAAWDAGGGGTDFNSGSSGAGGLLGGAAGSAGSSGSSWLSRNWPLVAGGLLLAGMAGNSSKKQSQPQLTQAQKDQQAANATPLKNYTFARTPVPALMDPTQWYTLGNQSSGRPVLWFDNPAGTYTPAAGPVTGLAHGGRVSHPGNMDYYPAPSGRNRELSWDDPEFQRPLGYVEPEQYEYARGGLAAIRGPRYVAGGTAGQADEVPARLSDGEYVIDAATVADLGDGNNAAGAKKLDGMRQAIAKHKGRSRVVPPKAKDLGAYVREGAR